MLVAIVLVGLGVAGYGSIFVVQPVMTGQPLGMSALYAVLIVPCLQWVTIVTGNRLIREGAPVSE